MRLRLFGGFELTDDDGRIVALPGRKDRALLAYLALSGERGVERGHLAGLLWHDRAEAQARKSLRQSLVTLRKVLNGRAEIIPVNRDEIVRLRSEGLTCDATRFEALAAEGSPEALSAAAELYGGAVLQDLSLREPAFQTWLAGERSRFDDLAASVLARLARQALERQAWTEALAWARRAVEIDPLRETNHRLIMRALDGTGRRTEALQQFHRLSGLLRESLDVRPDPDTVALFHEIRRRKDGAMRRAAPSSFERAEERGTQGTAMPGLIVLPIRIAPELEARIPSDGLTEELVVALASYRWFFVISTIQAMTYRGLAVAPTELGRTLGVDYVLSGRLEERGNRLVFHLELSETGRGALVWSERCHCLADELLLAQDELAREIAHVIEPELLRHQDELALRRPLQDLDPWALTVRARRQADLGRRDTLASAVALARRAAELAPDSAFGHAALSWALWMRHKLIEPSAGDVADSRAAAERAIERDPHYYLSHMTLGGCRIAERAHEGAIVSLRRAADLNPSFPATYNQLVACLTYVGRPHDALEYVSPLDRVSPNDPFLPFYRCVRALTYFCIGDDGTAIENARFSLNHHPGWLLSELVLVAACQRAGLRDAAAREVAAFRTLYGDFTLADLRNRALFKHEKDFERLAGPLRAAGLITPSPAAGPRPRRPQAVPA